MQSPRGIARTRFLGTFTRRYSRLLLAPFSHQNATNVFHVWNALSLAAVAVSALGVVAIAAPHLNPIEKPILFGFCTVTGFHFWPLRSELFFGQPDPIVVTVLVFAAFMSQRSRPVWSGVFDGVAGLMKVWPAATALYYFRRGGSRRLRSLGAVLITMCVAPISALATGGATGFAAMFKNIFDFGSQPGLIGYSVWGIPRLVFSRSGLAQPLMVSATLRSLVTVALLLWVLTLASQPWRQRTKGS